MIKTIEGNLMAQGKKFAIVASRFNDFITKELLSGCLDTLVRHGAEESGIEVVWVPGAFEIPTIADRFLRSGSYDAVICLGAVIRGATPHFEFVANECAKGVANVSLKSGRPVIFGVVITDTIEQAIERAGTKQGNKGKEAALNAIEMVNLMSKL